MITPNEQTLGRPKATTGNQASDDAIVPQSPNNAGSSSIDPDHERPGGMSGGLGENVLPVHDGHLSVGQGQEERQ